MAYLVLARKYRPATFEEVVGQEHVTVTLQRALETGRLHHAFLFSGVRGTGKTTTARILAKALNCEKGPTPTPCNECRACADIAAGRCMDVLEIDGASHTGVDDIRQLREQVHYLPSTVRQKVYIIDEVHMLSVSAFNALLKTLEEPPPHVTFIFATTEPQRIPATILSRCQRLDFHRIPTEVVQAHLVKVLEREGLSAEPAALRLLALQAEGSIRDSLSLLDQVLAYAAGQELTEELVRQVLGVPDRAVLRGLAEGLLNRDPDAVLNVLDAAYREGWDLVQLVHALAEYFRDLAVVRLTAHPERLVHAGASELEELRNLASRCAPERLLELFDAVSRTVEDVARSQFPRLTCEMRLAEAALTEPILPVEELLSRLESLELRLGRGGVAHGASGVRAHPPGSKQDPPTPDLTNRAKTTPGTVAPREPARSTKSSTPRDRPKPRTQAEDPATGQAPPISSAAGNLPALEPSEAMARWRELLDGLRSRKAAPMKAIFKKLGLWEVREGRDRISVRLVVPDGDFVATQVTEDRVQALSDQLSRTARKQVSLRVEPARAYESATGGKASDLPTLASKLEEHRRQAVEKLRRRVEASPSIRAAADILGAKLERICPVDPGDGTKEGR